MENDPEIHDSARQNECSEFIFPDVIIVMSSAGLTLRTCALPIMQGKLAEQIEQLYDDHYPSCYRFLVFTGSSPDKAVELLQESFLRLHQTLKSGSRLENPRSWLIRVLQRLRVDEFRRSARISSFEDLPVEIWQSAAAASGNPETDLLDQERFARLRAAVAELTETQYQYLALRAEGMKFREIADLHGVTVGSVFDACSRALKKLGRLTNG
jgi:RNA polymerase sigma-70 factor, ECF subfamily